MFGLTIWASCSLALDAAESSSCGYFLTCAHGDVWVWSFMAFVCICRNGTVLHFQSEPKTLFTFEHSLGLTCLIDSANRVLLDPWPAPREPWGIISSPCNEWRGYTLQPPDKKPPDSECWGMGTTCWPFFVLIRPFRNFGYSWVTTYTQNGGFHKLRCPQMDGL